MSHPGDRSFFSTADVGLVFAAVDIYVWKASLREFKSWDVFMPATSSHGEEMVGNQGILPAHEMAYHVYQ
jgi:hypothetical protein